MTVQSPLPPNTTPASGLRADKTLRTPPTVNLEALDNETPVSKLWIASGLLGLALIVVGMIISGLQSGTSRSDSLGSNAVLVMLFYGGLFMAATCFIVYYNKHHKAQAAGYAKFLSDNGWADCQESNFDDVATSLLGVGHGQTVDQAFAGQYRGRGFRGVLYDYTTGNGKSEQTHYFINLCFDLSQAFPLVVLDNKHNNVLGLSDLPERVAGGKTLELEGNFNDSYRTTVMPGTEQQVLELLTPDFMSELMGAPKQTDIEIEGKKVFIILHEKSFKASGMRVLFATADIVLNHLNELADSWQASSSADTVKQIETSALAPRQKLLLKGRRAGLAGTAVLLLLYALFGLLESHWGGPLVFILMALVVLAVGIYAYQHRP